ncbi:MAG: Gfo/Idh/MocA family protein [Planctomycetota bacterium]
MDKVIKVAIAGQGRSGYRIHANCLKGMKESYEIAAVADPIDERMIDGKEILGAEAYSDYKEMLAKGGFDLFVNALPTPLHVPATIEALDAGYHVVCEKPMASNVADFDKMVTAAKDNERLLAPFQNNRLQPFFDQVRKVIDAGVLGKILHIRSTWGRFSRRWDWQTLQENHGGTLFNTGPHAVDQALTLLDEDYEPEVFCRMDCNHTMGGDADDLCMLTLFDRERKNPTVEILLTSYLGYPPAHLYTICGTTGSMIANASEVKWKYFDPETAPKHEFWTNWSVDRQYPGEVLDWIEKSWTLDQQMLVDAVGYTLKSLPSGPHRFYKNIYDVLQDDAELLITTKQVRKQIAIMEESHRQNPLPSKS